LSVGASSVELYKKRRRAASLAAATDLRGVDRAPGAAETDRPARWTDPPAMPYEPPKHCAHCGSALAPVENQPGQRLCPAEACGRITYLSPIPVVAAIVQRGDDVILVRSHGWPETWYGLVTGFLEPNEEPDAAARRELVEELGLEPGETTLIGAYGFAQMNQVIIAYHIKAQGEIRLDETELAGFKSVPLAKLQPWPFGTGAAVRDFLAMRAAKG
jgi:NAD+ diphosphatase